MAHHIIGFDRHRQHVNKLATIPILYTHLDWNTNAHRDNNKKISILMIITSVAKTMMRTQPSGPRFVWLFF